MTRKYNLYRAPGQHLMMAHRIIIECQYNANLRKPAKHRLSLRAVAESLGLPFTTLRTEINRGIIDKPNTFKDKDIYDYSAAKAQADADEKAMNKGCPMKTTTEIARLLQIEILEKKHSPNHARATLLKLKLPWVPSTSTIYYHIHHGDLGIEPGQTPYRPKPHRRKNSPVRRSLKNPGNLSIEERPPEVGLRLEPGHWEMDTIVSCVGGKGGLLALVERSTRFYILFKLKSITQKEVLRALRAIIRSGRLKIVRSITTDNGCEFLNPAAITALFETVNRELKVYYTHAYAAWEKGSVENANRHVRRWYPKGTDFYRFSGRHFDDLAETINSIPRPVSLKGKTAHEAFQNVV